MLTDKEIATLRYNAGRMLDILDAYRDGVFSDLETRYQVYAECHASLAIVDPEEVA